ncbi:carboxypeptidase-like regulatory domain-containing protein [Candidatus Marinimicrobia bacterium]|nr:carboxypeptidase-like regulatory domain-containing protein [Candidatus Neomarinimicrobiota bacterium]
MISRLLLLALIYLSGFVVAGTDGTIRGKVSDEDSMELPGATIYLPGLGVGAAADVNGNFIILNIPVGKYDVVVQMVGYQKKTYKEIHVVMDQTVWLNPTLPVAAVEGDEVEVLGTRPLVERGSTSKKITVDKEAIQSLPIRDMSELYSLQSGVVKVESKTRGIPNQEERGLEEVHVRGGRSGEIAYMIDGMYIRNPIFGGIGSGTRLNLFAINEFDWQPGGFNAEYGDAMSAVSNWHTSSGGENIEYHFEYETSLVGAFLNELRGKTKDTENFDKLRGLNDYNFGIGGPVLGIPKLRFWFSGQHTTEENYSVYEFDDRVYLGEDQDLLLDTLALNKSNLVNPWDNISGFRGFGFDKTTDIFTKLSYKYSGKLRFHLSYWRVANHLQAFNARYLYWDEGRNELFRDTYRVNFEINHSLTPKTFYTVRFARFIQDQFQGVRWRDNDNDGFPNWFEWRHAAGNKDISDPENSNVVPYRIGEDGDTVRYTNRDDISGWHVGATPGMWNWESAEKFDDSNGNGVWDVGESFTDWDNDGSWDGPELVKELEYRDDSYWLEPEMYEDYEPFLDYNSIRLQFENIPGNSRAPVNTPWDPENIYYYMPTPQGDVWEEGRAFGGHDNFYADSRAVTDEVRIDLTSQISDKWKARWGFDYKYHRLNFYEIISPWLGQAASRQTFAEYWQDTGPDGLLPIDSGYVNPDIGENNGKWDEGEDYSDSNENGRWDNYREPEEFSAYMQNTFEVPWMVINYGIRIDAVNYNTQIWADTTGKYTPGTPWYFSDLNDNDTWDNNEEVSTLAGLPRQKVILKSADWFYKISPRIGFSHVITDKSTFTFNYGLYYQTPKYQNIYLNTNRMEDPEELFEEGNGEVGNATMNAQRTQSYSAGFNVQVGQSWSYSLMTWVKNMDQLTKNTFQRSGVYSYNISENGDYGSAKGIDLTLKFRGRAFGSQLQYTYSIAKNNSEYPWANVSGQYVDAPSQESLQFYDRPHDLTFWFYTGLPFGINAAVTAFYQSGGPYTPYIFAGKDPKPDERNINTKRGPAFRNANLNFSKYVSIMNHRVSLGLSVYNFLDIRNEIDVWPLTGKADDPGAYYTDRVGLADSEHYLSSAYYDRPWRSSQPREVNFNVRFDFD